MSVLGGKPTLTQEEPRAHKPWVLSVYFPPRVEIDPQYGWQFSLQLGEAFDFEIPFRKALNAIVEILERSEASSLELPPFSPDEDFVEGSLTFGRAKLGVYYEYSLGYLSLMSCNREALQDVAERLSPFINLKVR